MSDEATWKRKFTFVGARPVHEIISMIKWIQTSRFSIKNSLYKRGHKTPFPRPWKRIQCFYSNGWIILVDLIRWSSGLNRGDLPSHLLLHSLCHSLTQSLTHLLSQVSQSFTHLLSQVSQSLTHLLSVSLSLTDSLLNFRRAEPPGESVLATGRLRSDRRNASSGKQL